jgi:hypothetical protein
MNTRTRTEAVMLPWRHFPHMLLLMVSRAESLKPPSPMAVFPWTTATSWHTIGITILAAGHHGFLDEHDRIRIQEQSQLLSHSSIISFSGRLSRSSSGRKANLQHWWHCQSFWRVAPPSHHPHPTNMTWIVAGRHHVSRNLVESPIIQNFLWRHFVEHLVVSNFIACFVA